MARERAAGGSPGPGSATPMAETPASVDCSLSCEAVLADEAEFLAQPGQVSVFALVELAELPGVQRREHGLAAGCEMGGQHPPGPVAYPQCLVALDSGDEAGLAADAHHQIGRLIDPGHQHLQMGQGDVTQHHGLLWHRTRAVEHRPAR